MNKVHMSTIPNTELVINRVHELMNVISIVRGADYVQFIKDVNNEIELQDFLNLQPILRYTLRCTQDYTALSVYLFVKIFMKDSEERDILKILEKSPEFKKKYFSLTDDYRVKLQNECKAFPAIGELVLFENIQARFSSLIPEVAFKDIEATVKTIKVG